MKDSKIEELREIIEDITGKITSECYRPATSTEIAQAILGWHMNELAKTMHAVMSDMEDEDERTNSKHNESNN